MTMARDEGDEILNEANHCIQKKWTMRREKADKGEIIMGWVE